MPEQSGTPFPRMPMLAISMGLISHGYVLTSLFPYVGYMVQHLGVTDDKDEAGKHTREDMVEAKRENMGQMHGGTWVSCPDDSCLYATPCMAMQKSESQKKYGLSTLWEVRSAREPRQEDEGIYIFLTDVHSPSYRIF